MTATSGTPVAGEDVEDHEDGAARGLLVVLWWAVRAEWTRLRTVRSTWWCLLAACVLMVGIGAAAGSGHRGPEPAPIWQAAQIALVPAQFLFLVVVLLSVTGEYGNGAIRSTLLWVPDRRVLLAARAVVPVAFVTACAVVLSAATAAVAWAILGAEAEVVGGDIARSLARVALAIGFGAILVVGLGLVLRNTPGTLTATFLLLFVLVITLGNSGVRWLVVAGEHLPGAAVVSLLVVDEGGLTPTATALVMAGWAAAALLGGGWSLLRRDST